MLSVPFPTPPLNLLLSIPHIQAEGQLSTRIAWERSDAKQKTEVGKAFSLSFPQAVWGKIRGFAKERKEEVFLLISRCR